MIKLLLKDFLFLFINGVLPKIPSRTIRSFFYNWVSSGGISKSATIGSGVKLLDIRNIQIGASTNINSHCVLDGRGATLIIGSNVDIAYGVCIWTLQHDIDTHLTKSGSVQIGNNVWISSNVTILPSVNIGENSVVGASSLVSKSIGEGLFAAGVPSKIIRKNNRSINKLSRLRRFR
jgi:acetyltransferase-like isoleucine patch superfamily enzyme